MSSLRFRPRNQLIGQWGHCRKWATGDGTRCALWQDLPTAGRAGWQGQGQSQGQATLTPDLHHPLQGTEWALG